MSEPLIFAAPTGWLAGLTISAVIMVEENLYPFKDGARMLHLLAF